MSISPEFIAELKSAVRIEELIGSYVPLKRSGSGYTGLCPFHSEKTPSFHVHPDRGFYHCFGCGAGGDIITFVRQMENLEYADAVRFLADRAGMAVPESDDREAAAARRRSRILEANREAARYFHAVLLSPAGETGLSYLRRRGVSDTSIRKFGLGFAPDGWENLCRYLKNKGFTEMELDEAKLAVRSRSGSQIDMFRNRIIYPIIDPKGSVVGFGARAMGDAQPKYLNTSDTPVFRKSRNLFALNLAKNTRSDFFILCEGYMDVIAVHAAGFDCAVATLGTALTEEQARILSNHTREVILSYDSDEAGQKATRRATGILEAVGLSVRVLQMEGAKDPDEYLLKFGAERFGVLIRNSAGSAEYQLSRLLLGKDLNNADQRLAYLREAAELIAGMNSPLVQDTYLSRVAEIAGADRSALKAEVEARKKKRERLRLREEEHQLTASQTRRDFPENPERISNLRAANAEDQLLRLLYDNPDRLSDFRAQNISGIFVTEFNRRLYSYLESRLLAGDSPAAIDFSSTFSEPGEMQAVARLFGIGDRVKWSPEVFSQLCHTLEEEQMSAGLTEESILSDSPEALMQKLIEQQMAKQKRLNG